MCGKLHILRLLVGLASALTAALVPPDVAARRAEAWLARRPEFARGRRGKMRPARKPSGRVRTYGVGGTNLFHLVALEGGGFVCLRPSGTEPKLKVYYSVTGKDKTAAEATFKAVKHDFEELMK